MMDNFNTGEASSDENEIVEENTNENDTNLRHRKIMDCAKETLETGTT